MELNQPPNNLSGENTCNQEIYDKFVKETPPGTQDYLCGPFVSKNELYYFDNYVRNYILDIGCGTGHRTFPEWIKRNLKHKGVEKFPNLIEFSRYGHDIVQADISDKSFIDKLKEAKVIKDEKERIDIAFLIGLVINGIFGPEGHEMLFNNIKELLLYCDYALIDTFTHFDWFETAEKGRGEKLIPSVPCQYFYSEQELTALINHSNLQIVETRTEPIMNYMRTHYLLRSKN
jgi:SAM-dependent methyltransferase